MADDKSNAPKVQVAGRWGEVNQISLDTNRPSLQGESLWRAGNLVAFATRDIYLDCLVWIITPAFILTTVQLLIIYFIPPIAGLALLVFLLVPPILLILQAASQSTKTHGGAAIYRLLLIFVGLGLALL